MELLWLAIVFYSIGLATVLYLRPAVMFNENGTWKEFGYQRDSRHTIFPVWLFIIVWAILSYVLSMATSSILFSSSVVATATAAVAASEAHTFATKMFDGGESESDEDIIEMPEPVHRKKRTQSKESKEPKEKEKPRPGYYVLEPGDQTKGLRKYVYYGPNPPPTED